MNNAIVWEAQLHLKTHDKVLGGLIDEFKFELNSNKNYFESLYKIIIDQQLNLKTANQIFLRFKKLLGPKGSYLEALDLKAKDLREIGLSSSKITYIKDLAFRIKNHEINFDSLITKTDQEIVLDLVQIKGIGIWSAQMFLIFGLARPNVLPTLDNGLSRAVYLNYGLKDKPTPKDIEKLAIKNNWQPYSTIATIYLWRSLKNSLKA